MPYLRLAAICSAIVVIEGIFFQRVSLWGIITSPTFCKWLDIRRVFFFFRLLLSFKFFSGFPRDRGYGYSALSERTSGMACNLEHSRSRFLSEPRRRSPRAEKTSRTAFEKGESRWTFFQRTHTRVDYHIVVRSEFRFWGIGEAVIAVF